LLPEVAPPRAMRTAAMDDVSVGAYFNRSPVRAPSFSLAVFPEAGVTSLPGSTLA
jgi:hypothetical protein